MSPHLWNAVTARWLSLTPTAVQLTVLHITRGADTLALFPVPQMGSHRVPVPPLVSLEIPLSPSFLLPHVSP